MSNFTNKLGVITIAIFSIILLAGYSLTPSVFEARKILSKQIEKQSGGVIKLVKFEKSNRQKVVWLGAKTYNMEYDAEIEFLDDCYWGEPACGFEIVKGKPGPFTAFMFVGKREAKKGQHVKVMG